MNKTLLKSVREYKKQSVLAPFFVILEVLMEVLIPMEMAKIIDVGIMQGNLSYIIRRGLILVIMAMLALYFGIIAGKMAATAGAGYAKNLRHDIFYKVQEFSFKNIDRFSTSDTLQMIAILNWIYIHLANFFTFSTINTLIRIQSISKY